MAPRLNKRQLREQEELEQLAAREHEVSSDDDDDDELPASHAQTTEAASVFAALDAGADEPESAGEEEVEVVAKVDKAKKSKSKKKKKKPSALSSAGDSATPTSQPSTPGSKKAGAKAGAAGDGGKKSADVEMDEIDRALAEIAIKSGAPPPPTAAEAGAIRKVDEKWAKVKEVFTFDPKFLDADAELRRMFGSKVINTTPTAARSGHHARFANNPHHSTSLRRAPSFLAQPEAGWSPAAGILSLVRYTGPEATADPAGEWWTYEHSRQYREAQLGFLEVLQQADGNRLYDVLEAMPYHVDTHMQLSEMMVQQGDLGASSTHLSKALYALSAPLPTTFPAGNFRLPYCKIENRAFFTGIARKVSILVKRGTWRTACEWAKIALGAGGDADPVGMLVYIDFLAPKARQNSWFLSLLESLPAAYPALRLGSYPGLAYAKALSLRGLEEDNGEDNSKSTAALQAAILQFPMVVPLLFSTLGGTVPPKLLGHRRAQVEGRFSDNPSYMLELLSQLYAVRSSPLWKEPPVLAWLQKTVLATAPSLDDSTLAAVLTGEQLWSAGPWPAGFAPAGIIRAAFLAELPSIRPYLPPSATTGTSYSYDPLPPSRSDPSATFYDDEYLQPLYSSGPRSRRRGPAGGQIEAIQRQLRELINGGAGQAIDPELREQLMAELAAMARGGRAEGGVPGEFPGEDDGDYEDENSEGGDADGDAVRAPGVMGRLAEYFRGAGLGQQPPPPGQG